MNDREPARARPNSLLPLSGYRGPVMIALSPNEIA
jgi:hypothetical protein